MCFVSRLTSLRLTSTFQGRVVMWINGGAWEENDAKCVTCASLDSVNGSLYIGFTDGNISAFSTEVIDVGCAAPTSSLSCLTQVLFP